MGQIKALYVYRARLFSTYPGPWHEKFIIHLHNPTFRFEHKNAAHICYVDSAHIIPDRSAGMIIV